MIGYAPNPLEFHVGEEAQMIKTDKQQQRIY